MPNTLKETGSPPHGLALERVWAGTGTGKPCELCGKSIPADAVQYDLEVAEAAVAATSASRSRVLSFHLNCYDRWRAGRDDVG
jgi:hypothetical protein